MAIHTLAWDETPAAGCRGGALSIGNFDGVHRGHLALLDELRAQARAVGGPAVAMTFDPHPLQLLRPEQFQPVLTPVAGRAELRVATGPDPVLTRQTTQELLRLTPEEFLEQVLRARLDVRALVEGADFRFGRNRTGDMDTLAELCRRDGLRPPVIVPPLT